jgi:DNA-binding PadR family transcriptional regulator
MYGVRMDNPQIEWELRTRPLLAELYQWSREPDRGNSITSQELLSRLGTPAEDQGALRDLLDLLKEGYVEGPTGNNPLTGDGRIIDIAFYRITEKGRRALREPPPDEEALTSQILLVMEGALLDAAKEDSTRADRLAQLITTVRAGGLAALRAALLGAAGGAGGVGMSELVHLLK